MIRKLLKSQKGSTLVMVLMTLSVLSILGTAAMSLGVMNLKMKTMDKKQKTSFYLSEAGLEEAYGIMMKKAEKGIKKGNKNVEDQLTTFIQKEREMQFAEESTYKSPYLNEDGSVDEEKIKVKLQEWFIKGYSEYLNKDDSNDNNLLKLEIEDLENYTVLDESIDKSKPQIKVNGIKKYPKMNVPSTKYSETKKYIEDYSQKSKFEITLISKFEHQKIEKNIKSTFLINIPKYNTPYYIGNDVFKLKENVLWTKALIADKNIVVTGTNVTVNGDIYAYGDQTKDIKESGILVGARNVTVNGTVATGGYLQTSENDSNITIKNGDVYCNSLVIPDKQSGSNITVGETGNTGDVNTIDDIELNGEESHITINGSYYGFSDGSDSSDLNTHEKSSSIVINSDDIGTNSSITIYGNGKGKNYSNLKMDLDDTKGTFINGTVYINLADGDYQTGESISVKGNYKAYTEKIENKDSEYYYDKVTFKPITPLVLVHKKEGSPYQAKQLAEYINEIKQQIDKDPQKENFLNLGNGNIDIKNIQYSIGAYIDSSGLNKSTLGIADYQKFLMENLHEYKYYVNRMADPQIKDYSKYSDLLDYKLNIDDWFHFNTYIKEVNKNEVFYSNTNSNKSISIIGPGANNPDKSGDFVEIKNSDGKSRGIIVTKGDVYISGKIDFKGVIVTKGNIYIQDDNPKKFTNDYKTNDDKPKEFTDDYKTNFEGNYVIHEIIKDINDKGTTQIGDLFKQEDTWSEETKSIVYESDAGVDNDVETYYKFSKLIDITKWQQSK